MEVLSIPGYAEAIIRERVIRDAAFLGITESIGPFEVQPMTLRHWMVLRAMNSPMLSQDRTPEPDDLRNFLWLLSPGFTLGPGVVKHRFFKCCRRIFYPPRYLAPWNTRRALARHKRRVDARLATAAAIIEAARAYVAETMQDQSPVGNRGFNASFYSDAAFFCALFGREYGWSQEETLNTPLKRIFQYVNELKEQKGSKVPLCNPSDRVRSSWMRSLAQKRSDQ